MVICAGVFLLVRGLWESEPDSKLGPNPIQSTFVDQQAQSRTAGTKSSADEPPARTEIYPAEGITETDEREVDDDTEPSEVGSEQSPWAATEEEACAGGLIVSFIPCVSPRQAQLLEGARQALREQRAGADDSASLDRAQDPPSSEPR